jgi:hypothetical protein
VFNPVCVPQVDDLDDLGYENLTFQVSHHIKEKRQF